MFRAEDVLHDFRDLPLALARGEQGQQRETGDPVSHIVQATFFFCGGES
jgi:hypothetical protein